MNSDPYAEIVASIQRQRASMTPEQKRRSFKRQEYLAKTVAASSLFCSVFGLSEYVYPMNLKGARKPVTGLEAMALECGLA